MCEFPNKATFVCSGTRLGGIFIYVKDQKTAPMVKKNCTNQETRKGVISNYANATGNTMYIPDGIRIS